MRTASKIAYTLAAASMLVGVTGLTSVANAAPTTANGVAVTQSSASEDEMATESEKSTRQFTISNYTAHTLTINDIWGTTGWPYPKKTGFNPADEFPLVGSVLKPGDQMVFEIKDWADHGITVKFKADNGKDAYVYMHVSGLSRYSDAQGFEGQFFKGGADVTILDKPGEVIIPATNAAGQAERINNLCGKSGVSCTFTPKTKSEPGQLFGPAHPFGRGVGNLTSSFFDAIAEEGDLVEMTTSLEISAEVKTTIMGAVESALKTTWKQEWKKAHTFTQKVPLPLQPGEVGWRMAQEPVIRVTGDLTVKTGDTQWKLTGLVFDVPDQNSRSGMAVAFTRMMTPAEKQEAYRSGGFVEAPWKNQLGGQAVQVFGPELSSFAPPA